MGWDGICSLIMVTQPINALSVKSVAPWRKKNRLIVSALAAWAQASHTPQGLDSPGYCGAQPGQNGAVGFSF